MSLYPLTISCSLGHLIGTSLKQSTSSTITVMAAIPPFQISRLQGGPQALRDLKLMPVLPCPQDVVGRFATLIIEAPLVDVTYEVVWTAGEPTSSEPPSSEPPHSSLRSSSPQFSSSSPQSWTINRTAGQPLVLPTFT